MIILNLSRSPTDKKLLKADLYNISSFQQQIDINKPDQEISGKPAELVTGVLKELQQKKESAMLHFAMPDVPPKVLVLLSRAILNHNETLPQTDTMVVKVWKDPNGNPDMICAMFYLSEKEVSEKFYGGGACGGQGGKPLAVAPIVLKYLRSGTRVPAKVQFEEGISDSVKNLFLGIVGIYNDENISKPEAIKIKVKKSETNPDSIDAFFYKSEQAELRDFEYIISGKLFDVVAKSLQKLHKGQRSPVKLQFEDGILQDVKDLFTTVIDIYNKSLEPKSP